MSFEVDLRSRYDLIRARLRNPARAVVDRGIDLRRPSSVIRLVKEQPEETLDVPAQAQEISEPVNNSPVEVPGQAVKRAEELATSVWAIIDAVASFYGVRRIALLSQRRTKNLVYPRHIICFLAHTHTEASFPVIGRIMKRDHTTIIHGSQRAAAIAQTDVWFAHDLAHIEATLMQESP